MTPPLSIWAKPALTAKEDWVGEEEAVLEGLGGAMAPFEEFCLACWDWERKAVGRSGKGEPLPDIVVVVFGVLYVLL